MSGFCRWTARQGASHPQLLDGDFGGFNVDRLEHSLQTATVHIVMAAMKEYAVVVPASMILVTRWVPYDHGALLLVLLKPFVSEANLWMMENHTVFQGYYYFDHIGGDKNARDVHDNPHFEYTMYSLRSTTCLLFDERYDSMPPQRSSRWFDECLPRAFDYALN
ncbi:MAG: phosphohydrolase [Candidatus Azotimanducaceae bacterium WSBS_2022_MAG_OTU7]